MMIHTGVVMVKVSCHQSRTFKRQREKTGKAGGVRLLWAGRPFEPHP
jgi:hypothetical protein